MSEIKFRVKRFEKGENQLLGSTSYYAEAIINDDVETRELAEKIANKTGMQYYMVQAVLVAVADQIFEECSESNRVKLEGQYGNLVTVYPKVSGSIDATWLAAQIAAGKLESGTELSASLLRADMVTASLGASIGITSNKKFSENASIAKVNTTTASSPASGDTSDNTGDTSGNTGGDDSNGDNGFGS